FSDWYTKRFTWDRNYNLAWNLTRSLRLNFDAISNSIIDELPVLDRDRNENDPGEIQDVLWDNLSSLGRPKNYQHSFNVTYALPFKYLPFLDFIDVGAQLATTYTWSAAALNAQDYGNVIQNSQARSINANVDFVNLYNKVGYLRSINNFQIGQPASTSTGPSRSRQRPGNTDQSGGRDSRSEQS